MASGLHNAWSLEYPSMRFNLSEYRSHGLGRDSLQEESGSDVDAGFDTPKWRVW